MLWLITSSVRPIFVTIEILCGLHSHNAHPSWARRVLKGSIRTILVIIITMLAIFIPSFDTIIGLMGSAMCFSICIILPVAFYLKLFGKRISMRERILDWFLIIISSILGIVGTVWICLPRHMTGA